MTNQQIDWELQGNWELQGKRILSILNKAVLEATDGTTKEYPLRYHLPNNAYEDFITLLDREKKVFAVSELRNIKDVVWNEEHQSYVKAEVITDAIDQAINALEANE